MWVFCDSLASVTDSISQWMEKHSRDTDLKASPLSAQEGESKGSSSVIQMPSASWTTCPGPGCRCSELDFSPGKRKASDMVASSLDLLWVKNNSSPKQGKRGRGEGTPCLSWAC